MPQIGRAVRNAITVQINNPAKGFNPRLAAIANTYGVPAWQIDFTPNSVNFRYGNIIPSVVNASDSMNFPMTAIWTQRSQNTNRVKFASFSGPVIANIDVHYSFDQSNTAFDFESPIDAIEDAMLGAMNDQNYQTWPQNMLYNGQLTCSRSQLVQGSYGWLQSIRFTALFELDI